jgi:hypothetical protein
MTPEDCSLESRLHELGAASIDPAVASVHLGAMAGVAPGRAGWATKLRVAAAFFAGLLIGGSGLAAANALPSSAQSVAHATLAKVGVNVPSGHDRVTEGCGTDSNGQPFKNHGQYVKAHPEDRAAAAASDCGKPKKSVHETTSTTGDSATTDENSSNCAGQGPVTPPAAVENSKGKATGKATAGSKCDEKPDPADAAEAPKTDSGTTQGKSSSAPASDNAGSGSTSPGSVNGTPSTNASDNGKDHTTRSVPPTSSTTTH